MPAHQLTHDHQTDTATLGLAAGADASWAQANLDFADWSDAPRIVEQHLHPVLPDGRWWFIRKHPRWRLRHRPYDADPLARRLDDLTAAGILRGWHTSTYEPETHAFGGPTAMTLAHNLFCRDSPAALALTQPHTTLASGRRAEVSVLAITRMLRGAALEPYEQGDVWARVADLRSGPTPTGNAERRLPDTPAAAAMRRMVTLDTGPSSPLLIDGPLTPLRDWLDAFTTTGQQLAHLDRGGHLHRGLRAVLTLHVLFHWNRLALAAAHQAALARLGRDTLIPLDCTTFPVIAPPTS